MTKLFTAFLNLLTALIEFLNQHGGGWPFS
jgi:hypothetical protein